MIVGGWALSLFTHNDKESRTVRVEGLNPEIAVLLCNLCNLPAGGRSVADCSTARVYDLAGI